MMHETGDMIHETRKKRFFSYLIAFFILHTSFFILLPSPASAQTTVADLQSKIDQRSADIKALEKEIASYQSQLNELGTQATSLSATIKSLQLTQKKLEADIKVTENKIVEKNLQIQQLGGQISDKESNITDNRRIISRSYATVSELGDRSLPELLLGEKSLSTAWNSLDEIAAVQNSLIDRIQSLQNIKAGLETNKKATEKAKAELQTLSKQLNDQKKVVIETAKEQSSLLSETKNSQSAYNTLLAARKQQKENFEREVSDLESAIKIVIDPNSVPKAGSAVLNWPLSTVRITQYFGNTEFAARNPQAYKGSAGEHNGIDFAASIGTQVKAAATGVVTNVITTRSSLKCGYGNWISVSHPNGLTTLYAHLSLTSVAVGSTVSAGQVIGYSGNTGYTTGPHLHFGLYVTQGFDKTQSRSCPGITIPYAALNAYLNPLSYLPL